MFETRSARTSVAQRRSSRSPHGETVDADRCDQQRHDDPDRQEGPEQDPRRHAGRVHHDELRIVPELVEHVRDRDHQRDRRDDQDKQRDDEAGDADEDEDALTLIRHQVDVTQRLRDPHQRGHAGANDQERTERGAKNIAADGPHPNYASPLTAKPRRAGSLPLNGAPMVNRSPFTLYLITQQNGLAKANHFEYAQQNVNLGALPGRHRALGGKAHRTYRG